MSSASAASSSPGAAGPVRALPEHCAFCFSVLESHLNPDQEAPSVDYPHADATVALFVTWKEHKRGTWHLRGCIGSLSPIPLSPGLANYAITSSQRDHRFRPITTADLPNLQCSVSLLVNFEVGRSAYDWVVGKHGIIIEFFVSGKRYSATYLPEVAPEQGWSREEAVASLAQKAGWKGKLTEKIVESIQLTRYESSKHHIAYEEWRAMA